MAPEFLEHQIFHARIGEFLPGLAEQHHQHDPLDLLDVDVRRFERKQPIDKDFPLRGRQNADLFEVGDVAAAAAVETLEFELAEDACAMRRLRA